MSDPSAHATAHKGQRWGDPGAHTSTHKGRRWGAPSTRVNPGRTLVLGLGNRLRGDDGVGPAVLEAMQGTGRVPPTATLWPAHEGDLLDALVADAWERLVVIDAAEIGSAPGSWTRLEGTQALARSASSGSHRLSLIDALGVAHALGKNPEAVCVFAIQPGSTDWSPGLSQPVAEAVETLSNTVLEMLGAGG